MMEILEIPAHAEATFLSRPNRFLARVVFDSGEEEEVHLHDPGRLPDLAQWGRRVLLSCAGHARRKTRWDLLAFRVRNYWCFCHSRYHRRLGTYLLSKLKPFGEFSELYPEPRVGEGRLDFRLKTPSGDLYLETKGVTWVKGNTALFPDAPTQRGLRHLKTLYSLLDEGYRAGLLFLVFRKEASEVRPAEEIQPEFAVTLREAHFRGLLLKALILDYDGKSLSFLREIPVRP